MSSQEITEAHARRICELIDHGLVAGLGTPVPGQMCIEAVVNHALGRPHGDDPGCVAQSVRRLKIGLNDALWSVPTARAAGLKRLGLAQLGTADTLDEAAFAGRIANMSVRRARLLYKDPTFRAWADEWLSGADRTAYSAYSAAHSAYSAAYSARDALLASVAEEVVQILIDMKAPGCKWLYLAPLSASV